MASSEITLTHLDEPLSDGDLRSGSWRHQLDPLHEMFGDWL
jgi:hypothetical protein